MNDIKKVKSLHCQLFSMVYKLITLLYFVAVIALILWVVQTYVNW